MNGTGKGLVQWDDMWLIGVDAIDKDHKKLVELINALFTSKYRYQGFKEIREHAQRLLDYTDYHFDREEQLMRKAKYSGLEDQIKEHRKMQQQAAYIIKNIEEQKKPDLKLVNDTERLLCDWLIKHIVDCDTKISEHLKERKIIVIEM
ncbi:MAG: hemerythrin family protein [Magnetococcales bacterium]|nr:hemerythrin family protein [Magnetococcales bacterium]